MAPSPTLTKEKKKSNIWVTAHERNHNICRVQISVNVGPKSSLVPVRVRVQLRPRHHSSNFLAPVKTNSIVDSFFPQNKQRKRIIGNNKKQPRSCFPCSLSVFFAQSVTKNPGFIGTSLFVSRLIIPIDLFTTLFCWVFFGKLSGYNHLKKLPRSCFSCSFSCFPRYFHLKLC